MEKLGFTKQIKGSEKQISYVTDIMAKSNIMFSNLIDSTNSQDVKNIIAKIATEKFLFVENFAGPSNPADASAAISYLPKNAQEIKNAVNMKLRSLIAKKEITGVYEELRLN